jgi:hypothetical protein
MVARNLVSGYLPLIALLLFAWIKRESFNDRTSLKWPLWALMAVLPYNGLFFNWSAEHEFAWLAFALMGCVCAGIYFFPFLPVPGLKKIVASSVVVSLCIYFIINRPGKTSWKGENYAAQQELGEWIKSHVDPSLPIFTNLSNDKITEYYAGRTFNEAATVPAAVSICTQFKIKKGLWLQIENNKVRHITYIN